MALKESDCEKSNITTNEENETEEEPNPSIECVCFEGTLIQQIKEGKLVKFNRRLLLKPKIRQSFIIFFEI